MKQRVDGSWNDTSLIATFLNTCCKTIKFDVENVSQFIAKVEPLVSSGRHSASFNIDATVITLIVLAVLASRFKARKAEWSLIERKAKKYL
jgi:6-phosphogluconate dehydrogenase (decarboxylating)